MNYHIRVRASALIVERDSVLLIQFNGENGLHYNLPGGGVEPGESIIQAIKREAKEEASVNIEVGPLAFVYEYAPHVNLFKYGSVHSLGLIFACRLTADSNPKMPTKPDPDQTGVKWVPLSELESVTLYPTITSYIVKYAKNQINDVIFIEECLLAARTAGRNLTRKLWC